DADLGQTHAAYRGTGLTITQTQPAPDSHLVIVDAQHLWNRALVKPDTGDPGDRGRVRDRLVARAFRPAPLSQPQPQPCETPRGGPAEQRPEHPPVGELPGPAPARPIVEAGEEPDPGPPVAVRLGHIPPVTGPRLDQRLAVGCPELQAGPARSVRPVPIGDRPAVTGDAQTGRPRGAVVESLRVAGLGGGVHDVAESQIPSPMQPGV